MAVLFIIDERCYAGYGNEQFNERQLSSRSQHRAICVGFHPSVEYQVMRKLRRAQRHNKPVVSESPEEKHDKDLRMRPQAPPHDNCHVLNRNQQVIIFRFRTGHNGF